MPPCKTAKDLRYTEDDLIRLDEEGKARRSRAAARTVDFLSATELLRSLGAFVDKKKGQLVRVSNNDSSTAARSVRLEYKTENGELQSDEIPVSSIYDLSVRMYKERGRKYAVGRIFTDRR